MKKNNGVNTQQNALSSPSVETLKMELEAMRNNYLQQVTINETLHSRINGLEFALCQANKKKSLRNTQSCYTPGLLCHCMKVD